MSHNIWDIEVECRLFGETVIMSGTDLLKEFIEKCTTDAYIFTEPEEFYRYKNKPRSYV